MRAFLLLIVFATNAASVTPPNAMPGSCQAAEIRPQQPIDPDGWLLLAALVVCAAGRWSRQGGY